MGDKLPQHIISDIAGDMIPGNCYRGPFKIIYRACGKLFGGQGIIFIP